MSKSRLDALLVDRGLFETRSRAAAAVMAGDVSVSGSPARKPGELVPDDVELAVTEAPAFVSRGGIKLTNALDAFGIDPTGMACLDAGASTGGFTDVLLSRGARTVYAVDVGRAQLLDRLRRDSRVVSMERTNLRELTALPEPIDLATLDLSFISLRLVLPAVRGLLADDGRVVALVKPQFEAGREDVPRGGVVRDAAVWQRVLDDLARDASTAGLHPHRAIRSPITGSDGNVEFLVDLRRHPADAAAFATSSVEAVDGV
jgi:23S rRNA (cytidine1920-2'-O)/16S rRNA (cytidine1409-2'-O)-methyltransferase